MTDFHLVVNPGDSIFLRIAGTDGRRVRIGLRALSLGQFLITPGESGRRSTSSDKANSAPSSPTGPRTGLINPLAETPVVSPGPFIFDLNNRRSNRTRTLQNKETSSSE